MANDSHAGERNGRAVLTVEDVAQIRAEYTGTRGEKAALARQYGVTPTQIHNVLTGKSWPNLVASVSDEQRFRAKVQTGGPDECWLFDGKPTHGRTSFHGELVPAHVLAFLLNGGELSESAPFVLHSCDVGGCCNPVHLRAGTQADNMRDMADRGRHPRFKLDHVIAEEIRATYSGRYGEIATMARRYGVERQAVEAIIAGRTWKRGER